MLKTIWYTYTSRSSCWVDGGRGLIREGPTYPSLTTPPISLALLPPHQVVNPDSFVPTLNDLLEERDPGLLLSAVTLLSGILARNGPGEGTEQEILRGVRAR